MKNVKIKKIILMLLSVILFSVSFKQDAIAYQLNASSRAYTSSHYYSDGTYEYATGLTYLMDNKKSGGSANNLSASSPQIQKDTDSGEHAIWNRFRDMWTVYSDYGKVTTDVNNSSNFDGWAFYKAEWATDAEYVKYCTNSKFYSDYITNTDWNDYNSVQYGIETAPPGKYFYCGSTANKYRRAVLLIFKRKLPKPRIGNTYIDDTNGSTPSYTNGETVWKRSGKYLMRTWAYDVYDGLGQYPQYSGGVKYGYVNINKVNPDGSNSVYTQIRVTRNSATDTKIDKLVNDANVSVSNIGLYGSGTTTISNPNSVGHTSGYTFRSIGVQLDFVAENNKDYRLYASAKNKQGKNLVGDGNGTGMYKSGVTGDGATWIGGFKVTSAYTEAEHNWLRIDDDAPSISNIPDEGSTITRSELDAAYNISAQLQDSRSGFKSADIYDNDTLVKHIDKSKELDRDKETISGSISSTVGTHNIKIVAKDNLDNTRQRTFKIVVEKEEVTTRWVQIQKYKYKEPNSKNLWVNTKENFMVNTKVGNGKDHGAYPTGNQFVLIENSDGVYDLKHIFKDDKLTLYSEWNRDTAKSKFNRDSDATVGSRYNSKDLGQTFEVKNYVKASIEDHGKIYDPAVNGWINVKGEIRWCTAGIGYEVDGNRLAVDGKAPEILELNSNGIFKIQDNNSGISEIIIKANDAKGVELYHKTFDKNNSKVTSVEDILNTANLEQINSIYIYTKDNVDNATEEVKKINYKHQDLGKIVFNPEKQAWTNKGKISEGKGAYPVNVKYTGTNPYIEYGTVIVHHEETNNVYDSYKLVPIAYSIKEIDVIKDEVATVKGDNGDISIKKEGDNLTLEGTGIWGDPDVKLPTLEKNESYLDEKLKEAPAQPTGKSLIYQLDWTKPPIEITAANAKWVNKAYKVSYKISDLLSGLSETSNVEINDSSYYKHNQSFNVDDDIEGPNVVFKKDVQLQDGIYDTTVKAMDLATNTNSKSSKTYYVDTTEPAVKFSVSPEVFDEAHGATREKNENGQYTYYGEIELSDNLSGVYNSSYSWTYGVEDKGKYTTLYTGDYTYNDRHAETIKKKVEKPVGDNLYLHVKLTDVAGNTINQTFGPFEDAIKLRDFEVTDVRDPNWDSVFWKTPYTEPTGVAYKADKLPIDSNSHPTLKNATPKKGYAFYFDLTSEYLYRQQDRIEITPSFYYYDGLNRKAVDLYYNYDNNPLVGLTTSKDKTTINLDTTRNGKVLIGKLSKLVLTRGVRICKGREWSDWKNELQYVDGKEQWWYGKYFIPSSSVFVEHGKKPTPSNILKNNKIIVNFDIVGYKNGIETLSTDQIYSYLGKGQWTAEGGPKVSEDDSFLTKIIDIFREGAGTSTNKYKPGDVMVYDNKYSTQSDYTVNVIQ